MSIIYHLDLGQLEDNYKRFAQYGPIYFPTKTNQNKHILKKLKKLGCGFECDSIDHIKKIYSRSNCNNIIFSNVAKTEYDIKWALKHKITHLTVDDVNTLNMIITEAKKRKINSLTINVRINIYDIFRNTFIAKGVVDSRLGATLDTAHNLLDIINNETTIKIIKGISFYVQAEVHNDDSSLVNVIDYIINNFSQNDKISYINIGGGNSLERLNKYYDIIISKLNKINVNRIILEPGRHLVNNVVNMEVYIKRLIDINENEKLISLYTGIYHGLFDVKLHNRKFNYYIKTNGTIEKLLVADSERKVILRGPTADSSDVLGEFSMPSIGITKDSSFIIENVGAYVEVFHTNFSGKIKLRYIKSDCCK